MKGLKLEINGTEFLAAPNNGSVHLIASALTTKDRDETWLEFSGSNFKNREQYTWFQSNLQIGDEFTIEIIHVDMNSTPIKTKIPEESEEQFVNESKLRAFNTLKKELESLELI